MQYDNFRVELRRHIGVMMTSLGLLDVEHPQKLVLVYPPEPAPGAPPLTQCGYVSDVADAPVLWNPWIRDEMPPKLVSWVESEVARLKAAGEFVDPPTSVGNIPQKGDPYPGDPE